MISVNSRVNWWTSDSNLFTHFSALTGFNVAIGTTGKVWCEGQKESQKLDYGLQGGKSNPVHASSQEKAVVGAWRHRGRAG